MSTITLTDYAAEVQHIDDEIQELEGVALNVPIDVEKATKYAYRLYQRASLSGDISGLPIAENVIDQVIPHLRYPEDLYLLKANIAFKVHRLGDVRRNLAATPCLQDTEEGMKRHADLLFQGGHYAEAKAAYEKAIEANRTWDNLARYAHFIGKMEDTGRADEIYLEAEDELTSKQMRSYAWVELQRGLLDAAHGRYSEASAHYGTAGQAYPGYWMVDEHVAGLMAAQGAFDEAAARYEDLILRVKKPEIAQALGSVYLQMNQPGRAQPLLDRALTEYLASANRGEVHYYHHLVDFHCQVTKNGSEAVKWARLDLTLRDNFSTRSAMAWALYIDGRVQEAAVEMDKSLSSGVIDAHLFSHAATIYQAAGRQEQSHRYSYMAAHLNPRPGHFHAHHH